MSNLPQWAGAATVYDRVEMIATALCRSEYEAQRSRGKVRRFSPPQEAIDIIAAMNAGEEEALKAIAYQYRNVWL